MGKVKRKAAKRAYYRGRWNYEGMSGATKKYATKKGAVNAVLDAMERETTFKRTPFDMPDLMREGVLVGCGDPDDNFVARVWKV